MRVSVLLNGQPQALECEPHESLMAVLRRHGLWSVKHGCETGECGACSVLVDDRIMPTCVMLAGQVEGRSVVTTESLNPTQALHPIQQAFADTGAIQCGYCTPAMVLAAKMLLEREPNPSEAQVREALSAVNQTSNWRELFEIKQSQPYPSGMSTAASRRDTEPQRAAASSLRLRVSA